MTKTMGEESQKEKACLGLSSLFFEFNHHVFVCNPHGTFLTFLYHTKILTSVLKKSCDPYLAKPKGAHSLEDGKPRQVRYK
jgi:hypothetical protein